MIVAVGLLLIVVLVVGGVLAKRMGIAGWQIGLLIAIGVLLTLVVMIAILIQGFANFG